MLKVVYWNIGKESVNYPNIRSAIEAMIQRWDLDIFFIADFYVNKLTHDWDWNPLPNYTFFGIQKDETRNKRILTLFNQETVTDLERINPGFLNDYSDMLRIPSKNIALIPVHLKSLVNTSELTQTDKIDSDLKNIYIFREDNNRKKDEEREKLAVFGDFNLLPWDLRHFQHLKYFNATADRKQAQNEQRIYQDKEYPFMYNPTWSLLGDFMGEKTQDSYRPAASFYLKEGNQPNVDHLHWHMLDQLIVESNTINHLKEIKLLTECDSHIFWDSNTGKIKDVAYSDHLPLMFTLE